MKGSTVTITRRAVDKMLGHKWPGNVRELENTLKRGAALCMNNQIDLNDVIFISGDRPAVEPEAPTKMSITFRGGRMDTEQRTLIVKTLSENDWNFTKTAHELGIGRTTLWRKIKKYNLTRLGVIDEVEV
jgi:transcriptional regulator of acetoin/glycerol metabolism